MSVLASANGRPGTDDVDALTRVVAGVHDDVAQMEKFAASVRNYWAERAKSDENARKEMRRAARDYAPNVLRTVSDRLEEDYGLDVIEAFDVAKASLGRVSGVEGAHGGLLAKRVQVGAKIREGIPPVTYLPGALAHRMVYAAGVTGLTGHPESGKSSLACRLALDAMAAGKRVVYLDWENGWQDLGRRFEDLGAGAELLDERMVYVPFPGPPDWGEYAKVADAFEDALWVFDSTRGLLGSLGIKENDASEVGQAMNALVEFVVGRELPALLIDHVTKSEDGTSGYARGSGDKLAAVQAQWYVKKVRDFSELEVGEIELKKWKARSGRLAARHRFAVGDGQGALTFNRLDAALSPEGKVDAAIIEFLRLEHSRTPGCDFSLRQIEEADEVSGTATKVRARVKALADLEAQPVKAVEVGGSTRYRLDPAVGYEAPSAVLDF